ncbi:MAG: geranylgeranyl reductase family protein [Deferribacteres bacterium]|nr:geranylgeranyl reductase family protein [Deferribacteres bacterium]
MPGSTEYDVIIAGAGPAGSTAGYILAEAGLRVLIIDKSTFPREKLCAGCITAKTVKLLQRVFGEGTADLRKGNIINFEARRYEIFYRDKLIIGRDTNLPFYFVERYTYDDFLLKKARGAGAEVIEGDGVEYFDADRNSIRTSSGRTFTARFIIGADGINSVMRRFFPEDKINKRHWQENLATGLEIFIDRSALKEEINHPLLCFDYVNYGYSWLFPNRDRLIAGTGGLNVKNRRQLLSAFRKFLSTLDIGEVRPRRIKGYPFPYGNFLREPVHGNIMLVGDAAGFADPLLGEGIFYAQRSAELASTAILNVMKKGMKAGDAAAETAREYIRLLQHCLYTEFDYALKTRNFIFNYFNKFNSLALKMLMTVLGSRPVETIHGLRSYRWMKKHES